jgi:meso-butanediol dehydrogenase/(S,S)-butanediol dehydrogenase/diacetyl reductase
VAKGLDGKVAVITGAGRGIGQAIAERYAAEGAAVLVADVDTAAAETVADGIAASGGSAQAKTADVRDPADVAGMFDAAEAAFGPVDIVVNNAGIGGATSILEQTVDDWDNMFAINVRGVFLGVQEATRRMMPRGSGLIINLASAAGKIGRPYMTCYCAGKHAVVGITRAAAMELAPHGVRVVALCPGIVDTRLWREDLNPDLSELEGRENESAWDVRVSNIPIGRHQVPEDVANAAYMVASDDASYITGISLSVDGGMVLH